MSTGHSPGERNPAAYVVCKDGGIGRHRIYRVDISTGKLTDVSEPIDSVGSPGHLAYDPIHDRLYISSGRDISVRGFVPDFWPVTVVSVAAKEFRIAARFAPDPALWPRRPSNRTMRRPDSDHVHEVYRIVVSPSGKELFVSHSGLYGTAALTDVWDAMTGKSVRRLAGPIESRYAWSPQGDRYAEIWPSGSRTAVKDGKTTIREWPGGISVRSALTGQRIQRASLEGNKGLHPPWGREEGPFLYFPSRDLGTVRAYNRDTGEVTSEWNVNALTGLQPLHRLAVSGSDLFIAATLLDDASGANYVLWLHAVEGREISRTTVGSDCTNPVVAYE